MYPCCSRLRILVFCLSMLLTTAGCTEDDTGPDPGDITAGGGVASGSGPNDGADAGTDADADADDSDADVDAGDSRCEYEPQGPSTDPRYPCCFDDQDCRELNVTGADEMYCYHSVCAEGGEGTCRRPPTGEYRCWDDRDCPDGYRCPHEDTPGRFSCHTPMVIDTPAVCAEQN